ncbi:hypothetical protein FOZ62_001133 [Perkinsus olseni]|uniref:RING-type domain-containing protein n=2 Tax=Perkinsus olseni TaxID=32597 RepID=A0A7J6SLY6_PEROL|nr:hypothetical protein FOZ62_001133 [Perkinsus olseni]
MGADSPAVPRSPVVASYADDVPSAADGALSPAVRGKRVRSVAITPNTIERHRDATRKMSKHGVVEDISDDDNDDNVSSPASLVLYTKPLDEAPIDLTVGVDAKDDGSPVSTMSSRGSSVPLLPTQESTKEDFNCPVCCEVLVRPVDVCSCGHHVCRKHVIDMVTHSQGNGFKCPLCRKEVVIHDYNDIVVDDELKAVIKDMGLYDESRRSSFRSSRSSTPLQERFNREFFEDEAF